MSAATPIQMSLDALNPEALAREFHRTYERLAPRYGYETRQDTKFFDPVSKNGRLMVAVCAELLEAVQVAPVAPVVVPIGSNPDHWNRVYGESYGVDWIYETQLIWRSMDTALKNGEVFVIRFPLQGNVKKLCNWNDLHKFWESHGVAIFPESQKCEWSPILPD